MGKSPMKTYCSRISPVSSLMKRTTIVSGAEKVMSLLRHSSMGFEGSPKA